MLIERELNNFEGMHQQSKFKTPCNLYEFIKLITYKYNPKIIKFNEFYTDGNKQSYPGIELRSEKEYIIYVFPELRYITFIKYMDKYNLWSDLTPKGTNFKCNWRY